MIALQLGHFTAWID